MCKEICDGSKPHMANALALLHAIRDDIQKQNETIEKDNDWLMEAIGNIPTNWPPQPLTFPWLTDPTYPH